MQISAVKSCTVLIMSAVLFFLSEDAILSLDRKLLEGGVTLSEGFKLNSEPVGTETGGKGEDSILTELR